MLLSHDAQPTILTCLEDHLQLPKNSCHCITWLSSLAAAEGCALGKVPVHDIRAAPEHRMHLPSHKGVDCRQAVAQQALQEPQHQAAAAARAAAGRQLGYQRCQAQQPNLHTTAPPSQRSIAGDEGGMFPSAITYGQEATQQVLRTAQAEAAAAAAACIAAKR